MARQLKNLRPNSGGKIFLYIKRNLNGSSTPPLPTSHSMDKGLFSRGKTAGE
jgi:hypothetical protein